MYIAAHQGSFWCLDDVSKLTLISREGLQSALILFSLTEGGEYTVLAWRSGTSIREHFFLHRSN
ncbi:unnamed protein product [Urochloa decumbens]|uniref:Uncharacterized protein n=1 Tax=Urochloa decumbens TaxID=240449 RepID=A0ABC8XXV0_9POAL